jgi:hypothetical protein
MARKSSGRKGGKPTKKQLSQAGRALASKSSSKQQKSDAASTLSRGQ